MSVKRMSWRLSVVAASCGAMTLLGPTLPTSAGTVGAGSWSRGVSAAVVPAPEPAPQASSLTAARDEEPSFARLVPDTTRQVVRTVSSVDYCRQVSCTVTQAWHKVDEEWGMVRQFRSTIGPAGWDKRREGDGRSPSGVYRIKVTFSTGRDAPGPMLWRQRRPTSTVSASPGRLYNTWVEQRGRTDGSRPSMKYGFIVDYNRVRMRPYVGPKPIQGRGSGIFYHTAALENRWKPSAGCTQIGKPWQMRWLLEWLRPGAGPRVVQNR